MKPRWPVHSVAAVTLARKEKRTMLTFSLTRSLIAGAALLAAGCSSGMMATELDTQLLSVSPGSD